MRIIDLTHELSSDVPCWDGDCGFRISIETDYQDCQGPDLFRTQQIQTRAGMGTHLDSPAHCFEGATTIEKLRLEDLVADCVVVKVDDAVHDHYMLEPKAVERFEIEYGKIKAGAFVIFYFGWDKYWHTERYRNHHQFPSIHSDVASMLLERNISGLGTDTLSADTGKHEFPVHRAVLGAGKYLVENIANAKSLPPVGAKSLVLPMKIKDGTEAPVRHIALL